MGTSASWTPERRARQREAIRRWRPWRSSTGPITPAGKARSARNAEILRRDPEKRAAFILVRDFLRHGQMTSELGVLLLAADLLAFPIDHILPSNDPEEWVDLSEPPLEDHTICDDYRDDLWTEESGGEWEI